MSILVFVFVAASADRTVTVLFGAKDVAVSVVRSPQILQELSLCLIK
jgi:hypothetical protein